MYVEIAWRSADGEGVCGDLARGVLRMRLRAGSRRKKKF